MKRNVFLVLFIITTLLFVEGCSKNTKSDNDTINQEKEHVEGDELSIDELKEEFEQVYDNYTLLAIGLFNDFEESEYPYISTVEFDSNDQIEIYYFLNEHINCSSTFMVDGGELESLFIYMRDVTNETEFKVASALSMSTVVIGDDIDMHISDGIIGALNDDSEEVKVIFNKYRDPVWNISKKHFATDEYESDIIHLSKYDANKY